MTIWDLSAFGSFVGADLSMIGYLVVVLVAACAVAVFAGILSACCCLRIVPAKRLLYLRNNITQTRRTLRQGANLEWPWESVITVVLPVLHNRAAHMHTLPSERTAWRYDPEPYPAATMDQVDVFIDLWIDYEIANVESILDVPNAAYAQILDNPVLAKTQELASQLRRADLNAQVLRDEFKKVAWPQMFGLQITHVGVQRVQFDEKTQDLLRAQSMGISPADALAHAERVGFNEALRHNKNASLFLGAEQQGIVTDGRSSRVTMRPTRSRRQEETEQ